jgi:tetratricopeptide (TPR) repeat protein
VIQRVLQDARPLVVLVVVALGALAVATTVLARIHSGEKTTRAVRHLQEGERLLASGAVAEAVPEFRASLGLARDNPEPARRLAQALLALGRLDEAESHLRDLLGRYPVDGPANRDMARALAAKERNADALAYYQRAIYGEWRSDPLERRVDTRFELAEYLHRIGDTEELVAELLLLKTEVPPERTTLQRRLAELFMEVGLFEQAVDVLGAAAGARKGDASLLGQLAEAQVATGALSEARATLRLAIAQDPSDASLRERMVLVDRVLALDPTLPRLRLVERTRRARAVLDVVVTEIGACDVLSATHREDLRARAEPFLRAVRDAEAAEDALRVAAELWQEVPPCHDATPEARAIGRVLQTVALGQDPVP